MRKLFFYVKHILFFPSRVTILRYFTYIALLAINKDRKRFIKLWHSWGGADWEIQFLIRYHQITLNGKKIFTL